MYVFSTVKIIGKHDKPKLGVRVQNEFIVYIV